MKYAALLLMLLGPANAQLAKPAASVAVPGPEPVIGAKSSKIVRGTLTALEKRLDGMLFDVGTVNEPVDPLGPTRGIYLEGYGLVFSSELSLMMTPTINPFNRTITKETIARTHQRKLDRLPQLRKAMREMIRTIGLSLPQVPENQQIVMVVRLDYREWEDTSGLPGQLLIRADRQTAMTGAEIKPEEN